MQTKDNIDAQKVAHDLAECERRGKLLAEVFGLKQRRDNGRYDTTWGEKTAFGLFLTAESIIVKGK